MVESESRSLTRKPERSWSRAVWRLEGPLVGNAETNQMTKPAFYHPIIIHCSHCSCLLRLPSEISPGSVIGREFASSQHRPI